MLKAHIRMEIRKDTGELVDIDDMLDAQGQKKPPRSASTPKDAPAKRPWRRNKTALDIADGMNFDPELVHLP